MCPDAAPAVGDEVDPSRPDAAGEGPVRRCPSAYDNRRPAALTGPGVVSREDG
ncbi:hypothetical protein ElP_75040 (plasmid) [Tautonia plasticadhaerens]|uniref:Uncharacterized protein n=1 Tax=Tautonia plasticadhaerens TaxID=2527974 RepID=A0A518HFA7_9BACT|nr:hypothetical protein ElP_75040 [Tautonia plasticadhaerens]